MLAQDFGNVLRVLDSSAEHQPGLAITRQCNHLLHHGLILVIRIDRGLKLGLDELPAALMHPCCVQFGLGDLAPQCGKVALKHQFLDADRL
jgi:hypothetical protein